MKTAIALVMALLIFGATFAGYEHKAHSASLAENNFEINLFSDKAVYKSTDIIQIWATLKYTGPDETVTIWHGYPYMAFSITDGKDFNSSAIILTVCSSTVLNKDELYHFSYYKSGGFNADDPDADFWENFYKTEGLSLPSGEYTIAVAGAFSLTEKIVDSKSGLLCQLKIKVA